MNWNRLSVFKMPSKYRRYNFQPRYYDERKEQLKRKIEREDKIASNLSKRDIKFQSEMAETWGNTHRKSQIFKANIRLLIILVLIMGGTYYLFMAMNDAETAINNMINK